MLVPKPTRSYNCTQPELYAIATILLNSFQQNLPAFTAFKSIYTPAYHADSLVLLNNATALPDLQQRDEPVELARITLKNKANDCLAAWQALKSYITGTFAKEQWKLMLESAGSGYYKRASNYNWEILLQMMQTASQFIAAHGVELSNSNTMPANFPSDFETLMQDTYTLYDDFKNKEQAFKQNTAAKVYANNQVYERIITIMKDGQKVFRNDAATRDRFIFKKVKSIVTPPDSSVKRFEGEVPTGGIAEVVLTDVNLDDSGTRLWFINRGSLPAAPALIFYFAALPTDLPSASGSNSFYVPAGDRVTNLTLAQAGFSIEKPYLLVYNSSGSNGTYAVEVRK